MENTGNKIEKKIIPPNIHKAFKREYILRPNAASSVSKLKSRFETADYLRWKFQFDFASYFQFKQCWDISLSGDAEIWVIFWFTEIYSFILYFHSVLAIR